MDKITRKTFTTHGVTATSLFSQ